METILSIAAQAEKVFDYNYHYEHLMEQSVQASLDAPAGYELGASPTGASLDSYSFFRLAGGVPLSFDPRN